MWKLKCTILCMVLICSFLKSAFSQPGRECVPAAVRMNCGDGDNEEQCASNTRCCWSPEQNRCYVNTAAAQSSQTMREMKEAERMLSARSIKPPTTEETARVFRATTGSLQQSGQVSQQSARALNSKISRRNFLGLLIDFPECAVKTPFCHRTFCNRQNPTSESDPIVCLSNPQCCFDKDLYIYKTIFGGNFMGGSPVCYHGPTSSRYRRLTSEIRPWNPFFQRPIIQIFETLFDNAIANFNIQITCRITNLLGGIVFLQTPKCGWEGITRLQCHLKGCCYNDETNECNYPSEGNNLFGFSTPINREFYPELEPQPYDEVSCGRDNSFSPNIFRRLPCRCNVSTDNLQTFIFGCPRGRCCPNYLALFPEIADLTLISGGFNQNQLQISPIFLASPFLQSLDRSSIASFYCPFFFLPLPGFPDLTASVLNCCVQQPCYHLKRGSGGGGGGGGFPFPPRANWGNWSPYGPCRGAPCNGERTKQRRCLGSGNFPSNSCPGSQTETQSCTRPECCTWSNWGQYSPCNGPCGGQGRQIRTRQCSCSGGQSFGNCPGQGQDRIACQPLCPPAWTPWRSAGPCNAPCGQSGVVLQRRQCRRNGAPASGCPGGRERRVSCQGPSCPASWSSWTLSGPCDADCEQNGFQMRRRNCRTNQDGFANTCQGSGQDRVQCRGGACPASWSVWSPYGTCNAPCDRSGQQTRTRRCQRRNGGPGSGCPGSDSSRRTCQGRPCPSRWTRWGPYGNCIGPCSGPRVQTRNRRCERPDGTPANNCPGSSSQQRTCPQISCYSYTDWSPYTPCMSTCTRQRSRYCRDTRTNNPAPNTNCGTAEPRQRNGCVGGTCVPPPPEPWVSWAEWIDWTGCSQTCGRGQRTRERLCLYRGRQDSPIDSALCICAYGPDAGASQDEPCNVNACDQGDQSFWSPWSPCSRCTSGNSRRSRRCVRANGSQVASSGCPGRDTETIPCDPRTNSCIPWSAWSQYTTVCSCPAGTFERVRCRISASQNCVNPEYEYRNCPPGSC